MPMATMRIRRIVAEKKPALAICMLRDSKNAKGTSYGSVQTQSSRIPPGLRIIVKEDRRAPTVVQMVWYRIGSMDEVDGASGVAHVLEHMMFKGTQAFPKGQIDLQTSKMGGNNNAFTDNTFTDNRTGLYF